jgi:hypothetical protein
MDHKKLVTLDIECLTNYLLVMFRKVSTGDVLYFEKFNDSELNVKNILHLLNSYTVITFNGIKYDTLIIEAAIAGLSNSSIYKVSQMIIDEGLQPWQVRKQVGFAALQIDHIDLIQVAPLKASLKIYAGRMHIKEMMDMPINHWEEIQEHQLPDIRYYCGLDLVDTEELFKTIEPEINLRALMSKEYEIDLRSKSDAQIAESVIKRELDERYDIRATRPKINPGTRFRYRPPENIAFQTDTLNEVLNQYTSLPFTVDPSGYMGFNFKMEESDRLKSGKNKGNFPEKKTKFKFDMGDTKYTVGIGGIHSNEKKARHVSDENYIIRDYDVASYYPFIILNNKLTPRHLGDPFLRIYRAIVERRLEAKKKAKQAKKRGDTKAYEYWNAINESLKITINGSFGKLGSKWSCLYAPDLMMQVTITGQLSLLMLAESLELAGIRVISANTDGIVTKIPRALEGLVEDLLLEWELNTGYDLEPNDYISLNSRDVNNYIAVKEGETKGKGAYADQGSHFYQLRSNPTNEICATAVKAFLTDGKAVEETIRACADIRQFVSIRTVNGGAVKGERYIGKAVRWYYGADELDALFYSTSGNKVPRSDGAVPLMKLPDTMPEDIDFNWYINEAKDMLKQIGFK